MDPKKTTTQAPKIGSPPEGRRRSSPPPPSPDQTEWWLNPRHFLDSTDATFSGFAQQQSADDIASVVSGEMHPDGGRKNAARQDSAKRCKYYNHLVMSARKGSFEVEGVLRDIATENFDDANYPDYIWFLRFDFLPYIPIELDTIDLTSSKATDVLPTALHHLQKFAVGLEQAIENETLRPTGDPPEILAKMRSVRDQLKALACDLHNGMVHLKAGKTAPDVKRSEAPARMGDASERAALHRNNYVIVRDVGKFFDWVDHVFTHFALQEKKTGDA